MTVTALEKVVGAVRQYFLRDFNAFSSSNKGPVGNEAIISFPDEKISAYYPSF